MGIHVATTVLSTHSPIHSLIRPPPTRSSIYPLIHPPDLPVHTFNPTNYLIQFLSSIIYPLVCLSVYPSTIYVTIIYLSIYYLYNYHLPITHLSFVYQSSVCLIILSNNNLYDMVLSVCMSLTESHQDLSQGK